MVTSGLVGEGIREKLPNEDAPALDELHLRFFARPPRPIDV
jgi:hypothetical protein